MIKTQSVSKDHNLGFDLAYYLDLIQVRWGCEVINVFENGRNYDIVYKEPDKENNE